MKNGIHYTVGGLFVFFSLTAYAQGDWKIQNPLPTGEVLYDVYSLPNSGISWAVGAGGSIIKTMNGGNSWTSLNSGTNLCLKGVRFFDENSGWAVGDSGIILKTTNGGTSWTRRTSNTTLNLRDIHSIGKNTVWALGDIYNQSSVIVKTTDGGETWTPTSFPTTDLFDIYFIDANNGWAVGRLGAMLNTTDGGATWTPKTYGIIRDLYAVFFINTSIGWASGLRGTIVKTIDGGNTWIAQTSGFPTENLTSLYFVDANTGWFNIDDHIAKTIDGGTTWTIQFNNSSVSLNRLWFSNATSGIAVGRGGIYKTSNGGSAWTSASTGTFITLEELSFVDANTGYAVGGLYSGRGGVVKTSDGGNKWTTSIENYSYYLRSVKFINSDIGWVVGDNGTILKTINGGTSWTAQTSNTTQRLNSVFFLNGSLGWAAGAYGFLLKTTDGGTTWTQQSVGVFDLNSVFFLDANTGWVSSNKAIQKTTNGGTTWTNQTISTNGNIYNLKFLDANNGWTCTTEGKIFKTSNGGSTWTAVATSSTEYYNDIFFTDIFNGWVVGGMWSGGAIIRKTVDGGVTWTVENSHTANVLMSVGFTGKNMGWASGAQGVILHYTDYSPSIQAHNITNSNLTFQSVNVSWTRGSGNQCALFVKQASTGTCTPDANITYLPNATFGLGDQIGNSGWFCVYNGSGVSVNIDGLQPSTPYRFHVCEYNIDPDFIHYNFSTATTNPVTITTAIAPPQITAHPANQILCESTSTTFSVAASGSSLAYQWQYTTGPGFLNTSDGDKYSGSNTATLFVNSLSADMDQHMYRCVVSNTSGSVASSTAVLTVIPRPVMPDSISGDKTVCLNSNYMYSVPVIQNASAYTWTFPSGFSGSSTNNSIDLSAGADAVPGNITVQGTNICGSGPVRSMAVDVKHLPDDASSISGLDKVCTGSINVGYETSVISGADYYIWSLPFGATGSSSVNSIMVNYGADPVSDQIKVKGHNMCGDGAESTLPVSVTTVPSPIGTISGSNSTCKNQNGVPYSVSPIPNAVTYFWTLPPGVTGSNSTNNVYLNFGPDAYSGDLKVSGVNSCGTGAAIVLPVIVNSVPEPVGSITGPVIVCKGESDVLYTVTKSERAATYVWDLPDGSSEITVTNKLYLSFDSTSTSGNLYVTPYNSCGGGSGSSIHIEVSAPPAPTISISDAAEFCAGDSLKLSAPAVDNTVYQWLKDGGTTGDNARIFYAKESGNYKVEVTDLYGCTSVSINSINVSVNPVPKVNSVSLSGSTVFCQGGMVTLSVPSTTGYIYRWKNEYGLISGAETNSYTASTSGSYKMEVSNSSGCKAETMPISVTVKPSPDKPVITTYNYTPNQCHGIEPIRLNAGTSAEGYKYTWIKDGELKHNDTLTHIEFYEKGIYKLRAMLGDCTIESDPVNITLPDAPEKPKVYVKGPVVWYMAASSLTGDRFQWYRNGLAIQGATRYIYVANKTLGTYKVAVGNLNECYTMSDEVTIPLSKSEMTDFMVPPEFLIGSEGEADGNVTVYPNPSGGIIYVEVENEAAGDLLIDIFNPGGQELFNFKFEKNTFHFEAELNLNDQPAGYYLVKLTLNNSVFTRIVIIE